MNAYIKLILAYLKIGLFGFGGGYAMLSLIQREVVGSGWITSTMFTDIVAISQMTPGPIGINSATYIGYVVGCDAGGMGWISFGSGHSGCGDSAVHTHPLHRAFHKQAQEQSCNKERILRPKACVRRAYRLGSASAHQQGQFRCYRFRANHKHHNMYCIIRHSVFLQGTPHSGDYTGRICRISNLLT